MTQETKPSSVPVEATQDGECRARWAWTEPSVWTDRMLAALETGVKGGQWYSLIDKVWQERNLRASWKRVKANRGAAGVDGESTNAFEARLGEELTRMSHELRNGQYHPQEVRRSWIQKPGSKERRPLGIPAVRDRVVQTALRHATEPILERDFAEHSYGFRPGRDCKMALREVDELLKTGHTWVVDADLRQYFDSIPHEPLMAALAARIADSRILELIRRYLKAGVMDGLKHWTPEAGTPQGAVISPMLANLYLNPLDHQMEQQGYRMVRYADDFVVLCRSRKEAEAALSHIQIWVAAAGLSLHPQKTRIVDATQPGGFDFLGYHFERGYPYISTCS